MIPIRASRLLTTVLATAAVVFAVGCGSARRTPPIAPSLAFDAHPQLLRGREAFQAHCHACHPHGEVGLGPALNNKPLPNFLIRYQVRHGLGAMPALDKTVVSPDELEAIVGYLRALRDNRPGPRRN